MSGRAPSFVGSAVAAWILAATACQFQVPAPTYVHQTKLIAVTGEVVEVGPLNPQRIGFETGTAIAEPMPGDRFAFEAVVVRPSGEVLGPDEVESIWFQCGAIDCGVVGLGFDVELFEDRCTGPGVEPATLGASCRLVEGDTRAEFVVAELDSEMVASRVAFFYGVIGFDGRSAEDCWAHRVAVDDVLERCAFIQRPVKIGPSWWMLAWAEDELGLASPIPIWQIPAAVYSQLANRAPVVRIDVIVDGALVGSYPDQARFSARLGSTIDIEVENDELVQLSQIYFVGSLDQASFTYWFSPELETVLDLAYTTETLHTLGSSEFGRFGRRHFVIDENGEPGTAELFLVSFDNRYAEDVARLEFEVGE